MEVFRLSVQARLALLLVLGACTRSETYGFVAVLGNDTTSVERVTRTGHRIIGEAIGRSPTVTRRHWEAELGPNGVERIIPIGKVTDYEQKLLDVCLVDLAANIEKGTSWVKEHPGE